MGAETDLIRRQIEQTRDEMGAIIDAIAHKADVQARAKERVGDAVGRARESVSAAAGHVKDLASRGR